MNKGEPSRGAVNRIEKSVAWGIFLEGRRKGKTFDLPSEYEHCAGARGRFSLRAGDSVFYFDDAQGGPENIFIPHEDERVGLLLGLEDGGTIVQATVVTKAPDEGP